MGDVWVAHNEATQAALAVKTIHRSERSAEHDERFRREARLSATISHRNVVRVFDLVDESDGTLGLVMELLHGGTLEQAMQQRGPLTALQAIAVAVPVLSAMHHVHQRGIVHRDVKPANVFLSVEPDGHVIPKVLDFGIAKLPASGAALTVDGSVLGTPHYMSPEQIRGQGDLDGRSDMFSFAVVLYEMLTGVRVFHRESPAASLAAVLEHEVDPDPVIEPRLWIAISRALAKRPYERYASCAELAETLRASINATEEDLAQALQELRLESEIVPTPSTSLSSIAVSTEALGLPPRRGRGRTLALAGSAAFGAAVIAVGLTLALTRAPETPTSAASSPPSLTPALDPRNEVPPVPPPSTSSSESTAPAASAEVRGPGQPSPTVVAPRTTPAAPRRPPAEKAKPRGASTGVATTPGF
jgi:serine/threonine-protein kinase